MYTAIRMHIELAKIPKIFQDFLVVGIAAKRKCASATRAAFIGDGVCAHVFLDIGAIGVDRPLVCTYGRPNDVKHFMCVRARSCVFVWNTKVYNIYGKHKYR